jgi:hypothetical protein
LFLRRTGADDEAAHETTCWLLLQSDYKPERDYFFDAFEYRRKKLAKCRRPARILPALTELKWNSTLRNTKMCLWENPVLGQAVRHSLTVEPETALQPWMAAWR